MSGPTRVCPACYAFNQWSADRCEACGSGLASDDSLDERLIWALRHPDTETAIRAAGVLAARGTESAIEPLAEAAGSNDPYRAAAAAEALAAFPDSARAQAALDLAAHHPSVVVRAAVDRARAQRREAHPTRS